MAVGDVNNDGIPDVIVAAGPGGGLQVEVIDGRKLNQVLPDGEIAPTAVLANFYAMTPAFGGGLFVAAGDVNGDGFADVIVGADAGTSPQVTVIDARRLHQLLPNGQIATTAVLGNFYAFAPAFAGGVRVAAADVNGDGKADVIVGAGLGGGPQIEVIDATKLGQVLANGQIAPAALLANFDAFLASFLGGVYVAAGDVNGDGKAEIVVGAGPGGDPRVNVFRSDGKLLLGSFLASDATSSSIYNINGSPGTGNGVRVATSSSAAGQGRILTGLGVGSLPVVDSFNGKSLALLDSFFAFDPGFRGGVFVGG